MNTTILARSPPAGFFLCPKPSNKQGEELMQGRSCTPILKMKELPPSYSESIRLC